MREWMGEGYFDKIVLYFLVGQSDGVYFLRVLVFFYIFKFCRDFGKEVCYFYNL